MPFFFNNAAKACVAAVFLAALVSAASGAATPESSAAITTTTTTTMNPFVLLKRFLLGDAASAANNNSKSTTTTTTTTATTTTPRAAATASAIEEAVSSSLDIAASARALGVSEASFTARGLEKETCPHTIVNETRDRRELNELSGWMDARATWYGGPSGPGPDGMSIYTGSCGYGTISNHFISACPRVCRRQRRDCTSRHTDGGYDWGLTDKCGQCFEVVCVDGHTRGKDWSQLGPWGGCQEAGKKSVTVMISDSCPCHHPNAGNKRWCCGDRTHLDLSYAAFDQIAVRHRGVVDLKVRPADCSKQGTVAFYQ